jgi:hypothetical protein
MMILFISLLIAQIISVSRKKRLLDSENKIKKYEMEQWIKNNDIVWEQRKKNNKIEHLFNKFMDDPTTHYKDLRRIIFDSTYDLDECLSKLVNKLLLSTPDYIIYRKMACKIIKHSNFHGNDSILCRLILLNDAEINNTLKDHMLKDIKPINKNDAPICDAFGCIF